MRLALLVCLTMIAFAANSVLTRAAVAGGMEVSSFGALRLWSGAVVLGALTLAQSRALTFMVWPRLLGALGLLLYIFGFTQAYLDMESGLGALLLFGVVQVTMFAGALALRETLPMARVMGGLIALGGLVYLVWPWQMVSDSGLAVLMMVLAGFGWGIYSLVGRGSSDALADTAVHFILASLLLGALMASPGLRPQHLPPTSGIILALISGALTSGLGYALWYAVLPRIGASLGAVAQLSVPPLAMLGGMIFLGEGLTGKFVVAALIILGGLALAVLGPLYQGRIKGQ